VTAVKSRAAGRPSPPQGGAQGDRRRRRAVRALNVADDAGRQAVSDFSLAARAGEIVGVPGVSGNGLHAVRGGLRRRAVWVRVRDWVVLYFYDAGHVEGQHTVVTETRGVLAGKRVVRGREAECREHYLGALKPDAAGG
jgi:hypothetical protein